MSTATASGSVSRGQHPVPQSGQHVLSGLGAQGGEGLPLSPKDWNEGLRQREKSGGAVGGVCPKRGACF